MEEELPVKKGKTDSHQDYTLQSTDLFSIVLDHSSDSDKAVLAIQCRYIGEDSSGKRSFHVVAW